MPKATLVLGKHSGRHAVQRRCEQIGVTLDRQELDAVYRAVIAHADREKIVTDSDLAAIVGQVRFVPAADAPIVRVPEFDSTPAEFGYGHGV